MEFKGTKGKWIQNKHVVESELGCNIAEIWDFNDEENQANALLISKAPEILQKLKECAEVIEWYMDNCTPENGMYTDFHNIGMNAKESAKDLIKEATTL